MTVSFSQQIAHYLEEKLEEEIPLIQRFSNQYTVLSRMINLGMAVHFFDQSL